MVDSKLFIFSLVSSTEFWITSATTIVIEFGMPSLSFAINHLKLLWLCLFFKLFLSLFCTLVCVSLNLLQSMMFLMQSLFVMMCSLNLYWQQVDTVYADPLIELKYLFSVFMSLYGSFLFLLTFMWEWTRFGPVVPFVMILQKICQMLLDHQT